MAGWHSDASQFHGDTNKALEQMNRDLTGQAPIEESPDEKLAREAYAAQEAEAKEALQRAEHSVSRSQREQALRTKAESDKAAERRADGSNYVYGNDGNLYFMDPATGKTYRKSDYGNKLLPVKRIPLDKDAMAEAFARSKARKTNSALPRF